MALLWIEGFEGFGSTGSVSSSSDMLRKYNTNRVDGFGTFVTGRQGGSSIAFNTDTTGFPRFSTPSLNAGGAIDTIIIGFAFYCGSLPSGDTDILRIVGEQSDYEFDLEISSTGELVANRRNSELGRSTTAGMTASNWYYIELKVFFDNSSGTVDIKVDGTSVLSLTSQDTLFGPVANVSGVEFWGANNGSYDFTYDDIYICDDSGSLNNDFLGDCVVSAIYPNAAGDDTDWTPDTGSNFQRVDEDPSDDDSSYVESSTSSDRDLYNYDSMPGSLGDIVGVQVNTKVRVTEVDPFTLKQVCKSGTTVSADSGSAVASNVYGHRERVLETDPDTSAAWTESGVNAAQFGIEVG